MSSASEAFRGALADSVELLETLPRRRAEVEVARERVSRFVEAHPEVHVDLAVDLRPGSPEAEYDLLLEHPKGGTVALSYRADGGNPWLADHAEPGAADRVVSVGDVVVTVRQALAAIEARADRDPGLVDSLVDDALVERAIALDPPEVTREELQEAVDDFRAARGLHSAAATQAWLERMGWTAEQLQAHLGRGVRVRKFGDRVTAAGIEPWFAAHRTDFELVRVFRVETDSDLTARRIAELTHECGLLLATERIAADDGNERVEGTLSTTRAHRLPPELAHARTRSVVALFTARRPWIAEVLSRRPVHLDDATRGAVREVLFRRWLDERREGKEVRWR